MQKNGIKMIHKHSKNSVSQYLVNILTWVNTVCQCFARKSDENLGKKKNLFFKNKPAIALYRKKIQETHFEWKANTEKINTKEKLIYR